MPKYLSGRVKKTPDDKLSLDRYKYLSLGDAESNPGDPQSSGISESDKGSVIGGFDPPTGSTAYTLVTYYDDARGLGTRYWEPVGGGIIPGASTVQDEGKRVGTADSITTFNFVGSALTAVAAPHEVGGNSGFIATMTVAPPGEVGSVLFKENIAYQKWASTEWVTAYRDDFNTSSDLVFNSSVGILTVGQGINIGVGGSIFNAIGVGNTALVGIGTTNPLHNLHVFGDIGISSGTIYDVNNYGGTDGDIIIKNNDGYIQWKPRSQVVTSAGGTIGNIQFHSGEGLVEGASDWDGSSQDASNAFVWDSTNYRVGLGSTQPSAKFDVRGNSKFTGVSTFVGITSVIDGGFFADDVYVSAASTFVGFSTFKENVWVSGIATIGNIEIGVIEDGSANKIYNNNGNLILEAQGNFVEVNDRLLVNDTTESTTADDGALQVEGGAGIVKNLNVGGAVSFTGPADATGVAVTLAAAGGITTTGGDLFIGGDLFVSDDIVLDEARVQYLIVNPGVSTFHGEIYAKDKIAIGDTSTASRLNVIGENAPNSGTTNRGAVDGALAMFYGGKRTTLATDDPDTTGYNYKDTAILHIKGQITDVDDNATNTWTTGQIVFSGRRATGAQAIIENNTVFHHDNQTAGSELWFYTAEESSNGETAAAERLRITDDKVMFSVDAKVDDDNARDLGATGARWKDLYVGTSARIGSNSVTANTAGDDLVIEGTSDRGLSIISGSSSSGNIYFGDSDDADVGRISYQHNDNALDFYTNAGSTAKLRITSDGNVGINESDPSSQLVVRATTDDNPALTLYRQSTGGDIASLTWETDSGTQAKINYRGAAGASEGLQFYTAGGSSSEMRMVIDHSGNVGIGTDNPSQTLTIFGASSSGLRISKSGVLAYDHTFDGSTYEIKNNNGSAGIPLIIGTKTSGGESLRIDASGKIGIGTNDPTGTLTIASGTFQSTTPTSTGDDIVISGDQSLGIQFLTLDANTSNNNIYFGDTDDPDVGMICYAHADNSMQFQTNTEERLRITSDGKVGIGTNNPQAKLGLHGSGTETFDAIHITNSDTGVTGTDGTMIGLNSSEDFTIWHTTSDSDVVIAAGNNERLRITSEGELQAQRDYATVGINTFAKFTRTGGGGPELEIGYNAVTIDYGYFGTGSAHDLGLRTNDVTRLRITSDGDVGIGTDNPTGVNAVSGNDAVLAVGIVTTNKVYATTFYGNIVGGITATGDLTIPDWIKHKDDTNTKFGFPEDDTFAVNTNNSRRLTINGAGGFYAQSGIATFTSSNSDTYSASQTTSITTQFHVYNTDNTANDTYAGLSLASANTNSQLAVFNIACVSESTDRKGNLIIQTRKTDNSYAERLRITSDGNVGIGTNNPLPSAGLHIKKQGRNFSENQFYDGYNSASGLGGSADSIDGSKVGERTHSLILESTTTAAQDRGASIGFRAKSGETLIDVTYAAIVGAKENATTDNTSGYDEQAKGYLAFYTSNQYAFSPHYGTHNIERLRIDSSGRLLVGHTSTIDTSTYNSQIQVMGTNADGSSITVGRFSDDNSASTINLSKSRNGTVGNHGSGELHDNDVIGNIFWWGSDGGEYEEVAHIGAEAEAAFTGTSTPGALTFWTTASGATEATERLRIDSTGAITVGTRDDIHSSNALARLGIDCQGRNALSDVGDASKYGLAFYNDPTTNHANGIGFFNDDGSTCGGYILHQDKDSGNIGDIIFGTSETSDTPIERLRITSAGLVGIGTDNPIKAISSDNGNTGITTLAVAGIVTAHNIYATEFYGGGSNLNGLVATQIPNLPASRITSGTFNDARIPDLAASKITSGTFDAARIPDLAGSKITGSVEYADKAGIATHADYATDAGISTHVKTTKKDDLSTGYLTFVDSNNDSATAEKVYTASGITVDSSTDTITATTFKGSLDGSVSGSVSGSVGSVTNNVGGSVGSVSGNVGGSVGSVTGAVGSVSGAVGSVTGSVGSVTGDIGGNADTASDLASGETSNFPKIVTQTAENTTGFLNRSDTGGLVLATNSDSNGFEWVEKTVESSAISLDADGAVEANKPVILTSDGKAKAIQTVQQSQASSYDTFLDANSVPTNNANQVYNVQDVAWDTTENVLIATWAINTTYVWPHSDESYNHRVKIQVGGDISGNSMTWNSTYTSVQPGGTISTDFTVASNGKGGGIIGYVSLANSKQYIGKTFTVNGTDKTIALGSAFDMGYYGDASNGDPLYWSAKPGTGASINYLGEEGNSHYYAMVYADLGGSGRVKIQKQDGSNVTEGNTTETFNNTGDVGAEGHKVAVVVISSTKFVILWNNRYAVVCTRSGTDVTWGEIFDLHGNEQGYVYTGAYDPIMNRVIFTTCQGVAKVCTISGSTISLLFESRFYSKDSIVVATSQDNSIFSTYPVRVVVTDKGQFLVYFTDKTNKDGKQAIGTYNNSRDALTWVVSTWQSGQGGPEYTVPVKADDGKVVAVYRNLDAYPDGIYDGRSFITQTATTTLTKDNFLGFPTADVTNAAVTVDVIGKTTTQTGANLIVNETYYVQDDGTIGLDKGSLGVVAGKAVSSTSLLITPDYYDTANNETGGGGGSSGSAGISSVTVTQYSEGTTERTCSSPIVVTDDYKIGIGSTSNAYGNRFIQSSDPINTQIVCDGDIWYDTSEESTGSGGGGSDGIFVRHDASDLGVATIVDFSTNLDVSPVSSGIVTVTASGGGDGLGVADWYTIGEVYQYGTQDEFDGIHGNKFDLKQSATSHVTSVTDADPGVFSFPVRGMYRIDYGIYVARTGIDVWPTIEKTTDNSTWSTLLGGENFALIDHDAESQNHYVVYFNVTDILTDKLRFGVTPTSNDQWALGSGVVTIEKLPTGSGGGGGGGSTVGGLNYPTTNGTDGYLLTSNGSGSVQWTSGAAPFESNWHISF